MSHCRARPSHRADGSRAAANDRKPSGNIDYYSSNTASRRFLASFSRAPGQSAGGTFAFAWIAGLLAALVSAERIERPLKPYS